MIWQYRSILFEFQKDGLLGDRYIDNDEMEKVLNDQGGRGWELVSVTPVQEGLLSFFKRALPQPRKDIAVKPGTSPGPVQGETAAPGKPVPGAKVPPAGQGGAVKSPGPRQDVVGDIKIRS